jgi:predicted acyltransferase
MGVLQRIALAYGIGAILCLSVKREYLWIIIALLLLFYWGLLAFFGGSDPYSLNGNFALKADLAILGKNHLYKGFGIPFEPEGLLGTIPSVCTVMIGYFVGGIVGKEVPGGKTVIKIILLGIAAAGLGYLWNFVYPINKPLWSGSYVLFTAGIAMGVFAVIYLIADVLKFDVLGRFFMIFGTNALFSYFIAGIWIKMLLFIQVQSGSAKISLYSWIYEKICVPVAGNLNGSLMFAFIQTFIIWGVALILYRKKIMVRL